MAKVILCSDPFWESVTIHPWIVLKKNWILVEERFPFVSVLFHKEQFSGMSMTKSLFLIVGAAGKGWTKLASRRSVWWTELHLWRIPGRDLLLNWFALLSEICLISIIQHHNRRVPSRLRSSLKRRKYVQSAKGIQMNQSLRKFRQRPSHRKGTIIEIWNFPSTHDTV